MKSRLEKTHHQSNSDVINTTITLLQNVTDGLLIVYYTNTSSESCLPRQKWSQRRYISREAYTSKTVQKKNLFYKKGNKL